MRAQRSWISSCPGRKAPIHRHGRPEDGLEVEPTQIGVFQPDYPLERVSFCGGGPGQCVVDADTRLTERWKVSAACGVVGFDQARVDSALGSRAPTTLWRLRGRGRACCGIFAGPYAGSSWAFFGVTNEICSRVRARDGGRRLAASLCDSLVEDTYFARAGAGTGLRAAQASR